MNLKNKIFPLALIGLGGAIALGAFDKKGTTAPPPPPPLPLPTGGGETTGGETTGGDNGGGGAAVFGTLDFTPETREFSKEQYKLYKRKDWRQMLKILLQNGYNLERAADKLFQIWYNPNNEARNYLSSAPALLFSLLVAPAPPPAIAQGFNITWDSYPIYDTFSNDWNGVQAWSCTDWKTWHIKLEERYQSTAAANASWESAWAAPDNQCWFLGQIGCPDTSYCRYDCDFVEYLASKGINIGNIVSSTTCSLTNVVMNIVESVENVSDGISNTTKLLTVGLPIAAVVLGAAWVSGQSRKLKEG